MKNILNLTIKKKLLYISFGIALSSIFIGGIIFFMQWKLNHFEKEYDKLFDLHNVLDDIQLTEKEILLYDIHSEDFYFDTTNQSYEKLKVLYKCFETDLDYLMNNNVLDNVNVKDKLLEIKKLTEQSRKYFDEILNKTKKKGYKNDGIIGELSNSIRDIEFSIDNFEQKIIRDINIDYLNIRKNEKDYLLKGEIIYIENCKENVALIKQKIKLNSKDEDINNKIFNDLDKYVFLLSQIVTIDKEIGYFDGGGLNKKIKETYIRIEENLLSLNKEMSEYKEEFIKRQMVLVFIISLLFAISILIILNYIGKSIESPL